MYMLGCECARVFLTQPRLARHRDCSPCWRGRVPDPSQRVLHAGFLIDRWRSRCVGLLPIESHNSIKPLILVGSPILSMYYIVFCTICSDGISENRSTQRKTTAETTRLTSLFLSLQLGSSYQVLCEHARVCL